LDVEGELMSMNDFGLMSKKTLLSVSHGPETMLSRD
jgi:hypothetical protein